jgi:alkylmercury lyase
MANRDERTSGMPTVVDMDSLVERIATAVPPLDPADQRIALTLLRLLALGEPASVTRLADAAGLDQAGARAAIERLPLLYRDEDQLVVGFNGLAASEMGHHRIYVNGRSLSTWCAWDTLFLPELLGARDVPVTSRSPTSDTRVALSVTPAGPTDVEPPDVVVSLLLPDGDLGADVIQGFCHYVHFFGSRQDAKPWVHEHPGTFLISLDDAYRLGRLVNHVRFTDALPARGQP